MEILNKKSNQEEWLFCPVCGNKTRNRIREDTILINFPLYCPKCKQVSIIAAKDLQIKAVKDPIKFNFQNCTISIDKI